MYRNRSPLSLGLSIGLCFILAGQLTAQAFTLLHSFTELNNNTNSDGANPVGELALLGNTLYGTAYYGGSSSNGTVFAVNTDGSGFTNLYSFTGLKNGTNSDGANSYAGLVISGNTLYGTAYNGGSSGDGAVFALNANGSGFTNLYSFSALQNNTNSDGANPYAGLVISGNVLYGTTEHGGANGQGAVFKINIDGTGFTNLHSFTGLVSGTNSDGANPYAGLVISGNTLYGTTFNGGVGSGTVFAVNTNGSNFRNLHSFTVLHISNFTNSDGANPASRLVLTGNTLYGTALYGGNSGAGTVFAVNTDGTGFTNLYSFTELFDGTNSDGANPYGGLVLSGNTLYGTAINGGAGSGTLFAVNTNGSGFTNLYRFTALISGTNSDGADPAARLLMLAGNTLYGTASHGGSSSNGTVFSLVVGPASPPQLTITRSGENVILTWPASATGFILQSATNLISPVSWHTVSPAPVVLNNLNTVTNPITGSQMFYRLSQNSRPQLTITRSGADVILTWPASATGFTLQSATNLISPVSWHTVSPGPVVLNSLDTVTNPITSSQMFYRLSQ